LQKLFGLSTDSIAIYLAIGFVILGGSLLIQSFRNPILVKLGVRNIPKRPTQTILIIIGLMLSTVIIGASFGIGDTVYNSIRIAALESSGYVDETIGSPSSKFSSNGYFSESRVNDLEKIFTGDDRVDGIIPRISNSLTVTHPATNRTEARMTVRGYGADRQQGFGSIIGIDGTEVLLTDLAQDEVILNKNAAKVLGATTGDIIEIYIGKESDPYAKKPYTIRSIAQNGGLASGGDIKLILMSLKQIQSLQDKQGSINWIGISNKGNIKEGLTFSEEIASQLRVSLVDRQVAKQIAMLLQNHIQEIEGHLLKPKVEQGVPFGNQGVENVRAILTEIAQGTYSSDRYLSLIANEDNVRSLLWVLSQDDAFQGTAGEFGLLVIKLNQLSVREYKADALRLAETIGTSVTTIFTIFGSFSIIVGLLLIFLVMVLLASSRSTEMGMARAIGLKRRHLIQMFTFEGAVYALGAAIIGTALGALVSIVMVGLLQQAIGSDEFQIRTSFTARSAWISFSTGFLLTLITVGISSYRVSKLNIVVAIRGLSEQLVRKPKTSFKETLSIAAVGFLGPIYIMATFRTGITMIKVTSVVRATILWPLSFVRELIRTLSLVIRQGWLLILLGIVIHRLGMSLDNGTLFSVGVSMSIIGTGLLLRKLLTHSRLVPHTVNRIAATIEGALLVLFWGVPFDTFEPYTGTLDTTPDIFVLGGVAQIGSAVWLIMNNSEVLLAISNRTLGRIIGLQATLKTAIAYPNSAPFRTGLTISMFGLVIFTLMIFAVLNNLNNVAREQPDRVTGGYDITASVRTSISTKLLRERIMSSPNISANQIKIIAGSVNIGTIAREVGSDKKQFLNLQVRSVDNTYLQNTLLQFAKVHPDYTGDPKHVWNAIANNPSFVVVSSSALPSDDPFGEGSSTSLQLDSLAPLNEKGSWPEDGVHLEIIPRQGSGETLKVEVIGVIDSLADQQDWNPSVYIIASNSVHKPLKPTTKGYNNFSMIIDSGVNASDLIPYLETEFIERGMVAISTIDEIEKSLEIGDAFNKLFQGFMGLGLVVGVIAIGVLSIRAVVERRQIIGTMRALGYKSRMVSLSFLLEALYITFLGIIIGLSLGTLTSWNIFNEISKEVDGLTYKIPWLNVLAIVGITVFFALLSSFLPSRQAAKIYPAEALRYE
jgi:putative ABC transport system permease protein